MSESDIVDFTEYPKPLAWEKFEHEVADYIQRTICEGMWGVDKTQAVVRRKPKYHSRSRGSEITFDISVEIFTKVDLTRPLFLWIIECKDYPERNVTVDEIEEFHHKLQQVGAHKGIIFTRKGFGQSTLEIAKAYNIGLSTLQKEEHLIVQMSASGGVFRVHDIIASICLDGSGEFKSTTLFHIISNTLTHLGVRLKFGSIKFRVE